MDHTIPFALAQLRISSSPAFPAIVLDDAAVVPVDAILPLAAQCGYALTESGSLDGLLRNWDHNFQGLCAAVAALDDPQKGKYFRSAVSSMDFFTTDAPVSAPRQILCQNSLNTGEMIPRLASTLVGPNAKVLLPAHAGGLWGEVKLGVLVSRPLHQASPDMAAQSIAGFVTVSDYTDAVTWRAGNHFAARQRPTSLAVGPYLLPAPFMCPQQDITAHIPLNGESSTGFSGADLAAIPDTIAALSRDIQLFPGDLICLGPCRAAAQLVPMGDGDLAEAAISGLGRQTTNTIKEG